MTAIEKKDRQIVNIPENKEEKLPPQETGVFASIRQCFTDAKNRLSQLPMPHTISLFHIRSVWENVRGPIWNNISKIKWEHISQLHLLTQDSQPAQFALLNKVTVVATNALSAVKKFFNNSHLIQPVLKFPNLLSVFGVSYGFYRLYFLVRNFFGEENVWEKLYNSLDIIEALGGISDSLSNFILGLGEASLLSQKFPPQVPQLAAVSIAFSMTSQVSKGILVAHLRDWLKKLSVNLKHEKDGETSSSEKTLQLLSKENNTLLTRLFKAEGSLIKNKIEQLKNESLENNEVFLKLLRTRIDTRIHTLKLSIMTTVISTIGLGILVFTRLTLYAHLLLLLTGALAIKYLLDERSYSLAFEKALRPTQQREEFVQI